MNDYDGIYVEKIVMAACTSEEKTFKQDSYPLDLESIKLDFDLEDVTCSICLDFPHDAVLLLCTSYGKGCRPFMCDTDQRHSNCLERFRSAYGFPAFVKATSSANNVSSVGDISSSPNSRPLCPLCRGDVTGWLIINEARVCLNMKKRFCEEKYCTFVGNFYELQKHVHLKHPHSQPSKIDPAQQLNWEYLQQTSEIIDVLSTIQAQVPRAVVLGDYVIEYEDAEATEEYESFYRNRGNWWTSCISCKPFLNFRCLRNRRRSIQAAQRNSHGSSPYGSYHGDSLRSVDIIEYRFGEADDGFARPAVDAPTSLVIPAHHRLDLSFIWLVLFR